MNDSLRSFLSQIFSFQENALLLFDHDSTKVLLANEKSLSLLEYEEKEIVNIALIEIFPYIQIQDYYSTNFAEIKILTKSKNSISSVIRCKSLSNPDLSTEKFLLVEIKNPTSKIFPHQVPGKSYEILDTIDLPILTLNEKLKLDYANNSARKTLPLDSPTIGEFDIIDIITSDPHLREKALEGAVNKQIQLINKKGRIAHMLFQSSLLRNEQGKFTGLLIILFDISELKEIELKLRNSEDRLHTILATMNNGIVIVDEKGIVQEIAPIFKFLLFQFIPLEVGDFIFSFLTEDLRTDYLRVLNEVSKSFGSQSREFNFKILETEYTFEVRFIPIRHYLNFENVQMLIFTDRSEAKRLDRQLIESMKFASIGEIAAGLAHEINNPLQSALLYLDDLIIVGEEDPNEQKMILKKIESANMRIRDLVRSLLDLGRAESQTRDLVSPYYILVRSSELVELSCKKKGIEFFRHAGPNLPGIVVRWQEIEQVLINCVVNSINALSEMEPPRENPKIEIGIDLLTMNKKDWVVFSIEDNGPGMSLDIVDKAFLPLFTTRREMQGTGLGLSISKKIINDHEGDIIIKSKLGLGTKIEILIPAQVEKND